MARRRRDSLRRLRGQVDLWVDLFQRHNLLTLATAISMQALVALVSLTLIFRWYVTSLANFKTASGSLGGVFVLTTYLYVAGIVLLVGIELDELLRADLDPNEAGPGIVELVRGLL